MTTTPNPKKTYIMENERVKPVIRNTPHGQIYIFLYDTFHRVYMKKNDIVTFLYARPNTSLACYQES